MKIGILQCDDVMEGLQPTFGNYPAMFERLFREFAPDWQFLTYRVIDGELPGSIDTCDGYITTGSRYGVMDDIPWIDRLEKFVLVLAENRKKFVGVCFGHHMLVKALGGTVERSERGWGVGVSFNQVDAKKPWMQPYQDSLDILVSHQDQATELPEGLAVLASSRHCPFYMVQYKEHLLGIQGHPEWSKEYSAALTARRTDRIPAPRIREAKASLAADVDHRLMAQWMINFFAETRSPVNPAG